MCKRIYSSYKIRVINEEGEKYIKLNGNIDETSYSTMLKYYHMTKYKHQEEDCTIDLVGVYEDDSIGNVIFSKTFCKEVNNDKELLRPIDEIVKEIKELLDLLDRKNEYHNNMHNVFNKKQDILLHKIESIKLFEGKESEVIEEKIKIIDELEQIRHDRRVNKNELNKILSLDKRIKIHNLSEQFNKIEIPIDKNYEYLSDEKVKQLHIMREYKFRTDKERLSLMRQLKHKYSKLVVDSVNSKIIAYNKSK